MLNEDLYLEFVMSEARKNDRFFLLDSGEGNGIIDVNTGWYVEDLSGWIVNSSEKDKLIQSKENGTAYNEFSDSFVFAKWSKSENGNLEIVFRKY